MREQEGYSPKRSVPGSNGFTLEQTEDGNGYAQWNQSDTNVTFQFSRSSKRGIFYLEHQGGPTRYELTEMAVPLVCTLLDEGGVCSYDRIRLLTGYTEQQLINQLHRLNRNLAASGGLTALVKADNLLRLAALPEEQAVARWYEKVGNLLDVLLAENREDVVSITESPTVQVDFAPHSAVSSYGVERGVVRWRERDDSDKLHTWYSPVNQITEATTDLLMRHQGIVTKEELDQFLGKNASPLISSISKARLGAQRPVLDSIQIDGSWFVSITGLDPEQAFMRRAKEAFRSAPRRHTREVILNNGTITCLSPYRRAAFGMIGNYILVDGQPLRISDLPDRLIKGIAEDGFTPYGDLYNEKKNSTPETELNHQLAALGMPNAITYRDRLGFHLTGDESAAERFVRGIIQTEREEGREPCPSGPVEKGVSRVTALSREDASALIRMPTALCMIEQQGRTEPAVFFPNGEIGLLLAELGKAEGQLGASQLVRLGVASDELRRVIRHINDCAMPAVGFPLVERTIQGGLAFSERLNEPFPVACRQEDTRPAAPPLLYYPSFEQFSVSHPERTNTTVLSADAKHRFSINKELARGIVHIASRDMGLLLHPLEYSILQAGPTHQNYEQTLYTMWHLLQRAANYYDSPITRDYGSYSPVFRDIDTHPALGRVSHRRMQQIERSIERDNNTFVSMTTAWARETLSATLPHERYLHMFNYPHIPSLVDYLTARNLLFDHSGNSGRSRGEHLFHMALGLRLTIQQGLKAGIQGSELTAFIREGMAACVDAYRRYDPRCGYPFGTCFLALLTEDDAHE